MGRDGLTAEVRAALGAVLVARTALNGGYRLVYPFLPEIARGLGVSLATMGVLLSLRAATGLVGPLVPSLSDRLGRRSVMLAGLAAAMAGSLAIAGASGIVVAAIGFVVVGLSKALFDIPMQGWFGDRVPSQRLGRALGVTELTWALSLSLALPAGLLIAVTSWRAPFVLVAGLVLVGAAIMVRRMDRDRPSASGPRSRLCLTWPLRRLLAVVALFRVAAELLFVVYARWLEVDFGLGVAAIGAFTLVIVAAELTGEGAVAAFADRVGLRRTILAGLAVGALVYASLGLVGSSLILAVVVVVGWFVAFEVTIVATIPLVSELGGAGRERLLGLTSAVAIASGGAAAPFAPLLFTAGGIGLTGLVAAACVLLAGALLLSVPAPRLPRAIEVTPTS